MVSVKICGLRDEAGVAAAVKGGASFVGFMFFPKSPRNITPDQAAVLARACGNGVDTVAVMVDPRDEEIDLVRRTLAPDWIQLHGAESPARVAQVRASARKGVIKVISVSRSADLAATVPYEGVADVLMFDAKAPAGSDRPGGNGVAFDWQMLKGRRFARPWLLSGGLDAANVARAIGESGAPGVDVSSGVESAPGIKDGARIAAFLAAAADRPF